MATIDEVNMLLDEIAEELPEELFYKLNGGVNLINETKRSKADPDGGLYTLGTYHHDQMGRYITLYYGSIRAVHGRERGGQLKRSLKRLLCHELTHHIESLAGERDLEIKDKMQIDSYMKRKRK